MQHLYETLSMFIATTINNWNSNITTVKRYLLRLFIINLMETVLKQYNKNTQLLLRCYVLSPSNKYCWPLQFTLTFSIDIIFIIDIIVYKPIPHDNYILYCQIYSHLNPTLIFPGMFFYRLYENNHPTKCIMSNIITLLYLYTSETMTSQKTKCRDIIPLITNKQVLN